MRKLFLIFTTVVLSVMCMLISASATEVPPLPEFDDSVAEGYTLVGWVFMSHSSEYGTYHCLYVPDGTDKSVYPYFVYSDDYGYSDPSFRIVGNSGNFKYRPIFANYFDGQWSFNARSFSSPPGTIRNLSEFVTASMSIPYAEGSGVGLWFDVTGGNSVTALSSAISSDSLDGVLGEVCSLVVIAVPVLAGCFGVRKGVVWLLARIRST